MKKLIFSPVAVITTALIAMYGIALVSSSSWNGVRSSIHYPYTSVEPIIYITGFTLVSLYYLIVWAIYGRDARPGTAIPEWELADELSPADIVYIRKRGLDSTIFTACLISMISKGYLAISNQHDIITLHRIKTARSTLSPEEKAVADRLFNPNNELELTSMNHDRLLGSIQAMREQMRQKHKDTCFVSNTGLFAIAVTASILVIITGYAPILLQSIDQDSTVRISLLCLAGWLFIGFVGPVKDLPAFWSRVRNIPKGLDDTSTTGEIPLYLAFFGAWALTLAVVAGRTSPTVLTACAVFVLLNWLFWHLLKTLTPQGAKMLDRIKGLQMYLETAEEDRLSLFDPLKTNEVFEKFFPYAFALGIDQKWSEQFDGVISAALVGTVDTLWAKGTPAPKTSTPTHRRSKPRH